jgi:FtsP/CotA-like multicopper oxidase with cupredoxin domain
MFMLPVTPAQAAAFVQCPGDNDGDATWDSDGETRPDNVICKHMSSGDGYANMGDGYLQYGFGFGELTGVPLEDSFDVGILNTQFTAPTIVLNEGEEFYLSLSNTGMVERPDLFDSHTVHFHGFPNASSVFDGVPDASISINMGATLTYYYNIVEPGTYLYHCHVEAAEHMQMGMQGNLYVHPAQDGTSIEYPIGSGKFYTKFAYNDADPERGYGQPGSTAYDVEFPLMLTGFDHDFHDAHIAVQPLPFAEMNDDYHMFNGRGYPATVQANDYYTTAAGRGPAQDVIAERIAGMVNDQAVLDGYKQNYNSQPYSSRIDSKGTDDLDNPIPIVQGDRILLRITNLSITQYHTITALGLPMQVIGQGGRELEDKYFTNSVNLGGGEAFDVILDTTDVAPGTYYVYTTELHLLSNNEQSFGGAMTEIVVSAAE